MPTINWFEVCGAIVFTLLVALGVHHYDSVVYTEEKAVAIAEQQNADVAQCNAEKKTTKEATDALQKNRDQLARRLAALKLQRPATCVVVTRPTDVLNRSDRPVGGNERGVSSDWLLDFAANECSNYWRQLKICDKFLNDERQVKP